jgi:hypothetical protein
MMNLMLHMQPAHHHPHHPVGQPRRVGCITIAVRRCLYRALQQVRSQRRRPAWAGETLFFFFSFFACFFFLPREFNESVPFIPIPSLIPCSF